VAVRPDCLRLLRAQERRSWSWSWCCGGRRRSGRGAPWRRVATREDQDPVPEVKDLVILADLQDQVALNGMLGMVIGRRPREDRYILHLLSSAVPRAVGVRRQNFRLLKSMVVLPMDQPVFCVLDVVQLRHLRSQPRLNGHLGILRQWIPGSSRWQVYIPRMGEAKEIAVQPRNLVLVYSPPRAEGSMAAEVDIAMADVEVTPVNPDDPETDHAVHVAAAEVASAFRAT